MKESEMITYLEKNFLTKIRSQLYKLKHNYVEIIIKEIKENFLEKIEYIEKKENFTLDKDKLDDLIKEYGNPQTIAKEYLAIYKNTEAFLWSPLIQIIIGLIFVILEIHSYTQYNKFGDFYLLLLVPTVISIFLLILGILALGFNIIIRNKIFRITIILVFMIFEIILLSFLFLKQIFNFIQLTISFILFLLMIFTYLIIDFLHSILKLD